MRRGIRASDRCSTLHTVYCMATSSSSNCRPWKSDGDIMATFPITCARPRAAACHAMAPGRGTHSGDTALGGEVWWLRAAYPPTHLKISQISRQGKTCIPVLSKPSSSPEISVLSSHRPVLDRISIDFHAGARILYPCTPPRVL